MDGHKRFHTFVGYTIQIGKLLSFITCVGQTFIVIISEERPKDISSRDTRRKYFITIDIANSKILIILTMKRHSVQKRHASTFYNIKHASQISLENEDASYGSIKKKNTNHNHLNGGIIK
jgi:hypothetical protein